MRQIVRLILFFPFPALLRVLISRSHPPSPVRRVDRVGGEGRVHVRRGARARHQWRAYPWRCHRDVGDGRQG
jgi:hypothetical protein